MPDTEAAGRTLGAMAERMAVVETKVGTLKEDTGVIRNNIHVINNELQMVRAAETRCADALEAIQGMMLARSVQVDKIEANVDALMIAKGTAEGAWAATVKIFAAISAMIGIVGLLAAGGAWALGHLSMR
jgi:hypothetical protein